MENRSKIAVVVAGSWGTALASVLAANGHDVRLWTRNAAQAAELNEQHTNTRFLGDARLPATLYATTDEAEAAAEAEAVLFVAPSSSMREVALRFAPHIRVDATILHATKGFEQGTLKRMTTVLSEVLARPVENIVVVSGPSHAEEVVRRLPTTVVVAAQNLAAAEHAQDLLMNTAFRVYTNADVCGVEIAGAIKNIIALGAGLSDGLGFGDNAKAALITRGLAEISRLGVAMGANPLTFAGLAGVGDLVVTCTSTHSRNWRAGSLLAQGLTLDEVLAQMGMVVEGIKTTQAAYQLAAHYKTDMPITFQIHEVLFSAKPPAKAVDELMGRVRTHETEY